MIIAQERNKKFEYYVKALRGQFGNNLSDLVDSCNKDVFNFRRKQTDWFMNIPHAKLQIGKFYLILYDFDGNKLYCPIFIIDYRITEKGKHVIYAINLDYLPFDYKMIYFNKMSTVFDQIFDKNADAPNFTQETPLPVNFEQIYKTLETNGGYNFAISAFDVTKIKECFGISTNLMYLTIHIHMRTINVALMKQLATNYDELSVEKEKLYKVIDSMDESIKTYEEDVKGYYKKLRNIENNYKLFEKLL